MILNEIRKNICDIINQSGLPLDAIYYVLKDIVSEVGEVMNQQEEQERQRKITEEEQRKELEEEKAAAAKELEDEANDAESAAANED